MGIDWNEISAGSSGGTELLCRRLEADLPAELLDAFQIIPSRVRELDPNRIRVLYCHDLPGDSESDRALSQEGWRRFHALVFVSNWQMQAYVQHYGIPWSRCVVMPNSIRPIEEHRKPDDVVRLIYTSTPHRGLALLVPVFERLYESHPNLRLEVFSSFKLYGWEERDAPFEPLFEACRRHEAISYHGAASNDQVREALTRAHVFAYPSIWRETSCLCLIEAMSAGLLCVHPNFGALYETAAGWTAMYQFHEDPGQHTGLLHTMLRSAVASLGQRAMQAHLAGQKAHADRFHGWGTRRVQWEALLRQLLSQHTRSGRICAPRTPT